MARISPCLLFLVALFQPTVFADKATQTEPPRLLACFPFEDDSSGTTADAAGGPRARLMGEAHLVAAGRYGLAAEFGGAGDWIDTCRSVVDTTKSWSVAAWVMLFDGFTDDFRTALSQDGQQLSAFFLQYCRPGGGSAPDSLCLAKWKTPNGEATLGIRGKGRPEANRWIHVAAVQDQEMKRLRLYIDGQRVDEQPYEAGGKAFEWTAAGNTVIGRGQFDGRHVDPFLGRIDEVYLFQGVLTADDVCRVRDDRFLSQPIRRGSPDSLAGSSTISLDLQNPGSRISPLLFGFNLEHTRRAVWQGLSAELLANRKFAGEGVANAHGKGRTPRGKPGADGVAAHWRALGTAGMKFSLDGPPFSGIPSQRAVVEGRSGGIGQANVPLHQSSEYQLRVWLLTERQQTVSLRLTNAEGSVVYAETAHTVAPGSWQEKTLCFRSPQTDAHAQLAIVLDGPGSFCIGAASLLPADHFHGMRSDVIAILEEMGVPLLRWPGGNFTLDYRWRDGLLPVDRRPPIEITWTETQPFADNWDFHEIGIDEFLALCRRLGAEPAVTINIHPTLSPPEDAAAWVEYCNGAPDTRWGKVRADRGRREPYGVKYWFVGNEVFGDWMGQAHSDAATYAKRLTQYAEAMKRADASITLIASGTLGGTDWNRTLIGQAGTSFDLLSVHDYAPEGDAHAQQPQSAELVRLLGYAAGNIPEMLRATHRLVRETAPNGRKTGIVFDEWNVWHDWFVKPMQNEWHVGPIDGCYAAAILNRLCREAEALDLVFASFFQPVQEGAIRVQPFSAELTTVGQVFALYRCHHNGRRMKLDVPRGLGIDGCASLSPDGRHARVTLVSRRGRQDETVQLVLRNAPGIDAARLTSLTARDLTPDIPLAHHSDSLKAKDGQFSVPIPRYGVALVDIALGS